MKKAGGKDVDFSISKIHQKITWKSLENSSKFGLELIDIISTLIPRVVPVGT